MRTWIDRLKAARGVSTPLLAVETVDPGATARAIGEASEAPVVWWDCAAGPRPVNDAGREVCSQTWSDPYQALNLVEVLKAAERMPVRAMLLIANAHRFLDETAVLQAVGNLRDPFRNGRSLILLVVPGARLPQELAQDVLVLERPLPGAEELRPIVDEIVNAAAEQIQGFKPPPEKARARAAEALVGLGEFAAESALSLSINDGGLAPENLWARKRGMINQTPGLTLVPAGAETFSGMGGLQAIREFGSRLFQSENPPRLIVWVDELEKAIAGAGGGGLGDSSGTSQDQLGVLLRYQEENGWSGILLVGPPGSGKSMVAKALGATHATPTLLLDLGAMKGSLVGQSEQRIRAAMRVIQALAGSEALFVATCNRLEAIPPELRRRYRYGIWFTDLPDADEREAIWKIHLEAAGIGPAELRPGDPIWTGAEIRNCCELAKRLDISPQEAAAYIVPVSQSDPEGIERLRKAADGRFLSASRTGPYRAQAGAQGARGARRFGDAV